MKRGRCDLLEDDPDTIARLLEFMYTGKVALTEIPTLIREQDFFIKLNSFHILDDIEMDPMDPTSGPGTSTAPCEYKDDLRTVGLQPGDDAIPPFWNMILKQYIAADKFGMPMLTHAVHNEMKDQFDSKMAEEGWWPKFMTKVSTYTQATDFNSLRMFVMWNSFRNEKFAKSVRCAEIMAKLEPIAMHLYDIGVSAVGSRRSTSIGFRTTGLEMMPTELDDPTTWCMKKRCVS
jgi:hypothetical protein